MATLAAPAAAPARTTTIRDAIRDTLRSEMQRDSRVVLLVHRQETMRLLGFPVMRYIDINDSEEVLRAIQMTADDIPLDIVLHTPARQATSRFGEKTPEGLTVTTFSGITARGTQHIVVNVLLG